VKPSVRPVAGEYLGGIVEATFQTEASKLMRNSPNIRLLDTVQTAALLGITPSTLKFWRHRGRGPAFIKLGDAPQAGVAYDEADVLAFIESRKFGSTSAYSPAAQANAGSTVRPPAPVSR
jgi:predicted DNA-binding transcriptional regulator AlpA